MQGQTRGHRPYSLHRHLITHMLRAGEAKQRQKANREKTFLHNFYDKPQLNLEQKVRCLVDFFMLLAIKSYTVGKPVCFPLMVPHL